MPFCRSSSASFLLEPLPKLDYNETLAHIAERQINPNNPYLILHYTDSLLYFLDQKEFPIQGEVYRCMGRFIYHSLETDKYYEAQEAPITKDNPFGWKEITLKGTDNMGLCLEGYFLFIDFPYDPKNYRSYSWILVDRDLYSFKKLIGADPKGGFRWYTDKAWNSRVVISRSGNTLSFKTRGLSFPYYFFYQKGYYFGYQPLAGNWHGSMGVYCEATKERFRDENQSYPIHICTWHHPDIGVTEEYKLITDGITVYKIDPETNTKEVYVKAQGFVKGCVVTGPSKDDINCRLSLKSILSWPYASTISIDSEKVFHPPF